MRADSMTSLMQIFKRANSGVADCSPANSQSGEIA
jgi:hypothetical protein